MYLWQIFLPSLGDADQYLESEVPTAIRALLEPSAAFPGPRSIAEHVCFESYLPASLMWSQECLSAVGVKYSWQVGRAWRCQAQSRVKMRKVI